MYRRPDWRCSEQHAHVFRLFAESGGFWIFFDCVANSVGHKAVKTALYMLQKHHSIQGSCPFAVARFEVSESLFQAHGRQIETFRQCTEFVSGIYRNACIQVTRNRARSCELQHPKRLGCRARKNPGRPCSAHSCGNRDQQQHVGKPRRSGLCRYVYSRHLGKCRQRQRAYRQGTNNQSERGTAVPDAHPPKLGILAILVVANSTAQPRVRQKCSIANKVAVAAMKPASTGREMKCAT